LAIGSIAVITYQIGLMCRFCQRSPWRAGDLVSLS
jgi:hypothetical protein